MRSLSLNLAVLLLVASLGVWVSNLNDARTRQGEQAHAALCVLRDGLSADIRRNARNLREGQRFIRKHPHGALGYTRAQLLQFHAKDAADLAAQKKRRRALSAPILICP